MGIVATILVIACANINPLVLCADPKGVVIESYDGSPNLPDWASYSMFLVTSKSIADNSEHPSAYFAKALGVDKQTAEGIATINFFRDWFAASLLEIRQEANSGKLRILCSGDWPSMSVDEYTKGQQEVEALWESLYQDHLETTLQQMSPQVRSAFLSYLQERKKYISHTKVDMSTVYKAKPKSEMRRLHARTCEKAKAQPFIDGGANCQN